MQIENKEEIEFVRAKILNLLEVYPVISYTMVQAGIGPQISPGIWRPILEQLIQSKEIKQEIVYKEDAKGNPRNWTRISLFNFHLPIEN